MVTSKECIQKWGDISNKEISVSIEKSIMTVYRVPLHVRNQIPALPRNIYMNKLMVEPFEKAIELVIERKLCDLIYSWNGCFVIRKKRGGQSLSLHSWAIAIDINLKGNDYGEKPVMPLNLVACFLDAGFEWGGYWKKPDGMHFQLKEI